MSEKIQNLITASMELFNRVPSNKTINVMKKLSDDEFNKIDREEPIDFPLDIIENQMCLVLKMNLKSVLVNIPHMII